MNSLSNPCCSCAVQRAHTLLVSIAQPELQPPQRRRKCAREDDEEEQPAAAASSGGGMAAAGAGEKVLERQPSLLSQESYDSEQ